MDCCLGMVYYSPASAIYGLVAYARPRGAGKALINVSVVKTELNWCSRAMHVCMSILFCFSFLTCIHTAGTGKLLSPVAQDSICTILYLGFTMR